MAMESVRIGVHNNDPEWRTLTDYNLNEFFHIDGEVIERWRKKIKELELTLPNDEELLRRWWRLKFHDFVRKTLKARGFAKHHSKKWSTEEHMINSVYPWMRDLWFVERVRLSGLMPSMPKLRRSWWMQKRETAHLKYKARGEKQRHHLRLDVVLSRLLWCRHRECWKLRAIVLLQLIVVLSVIYIVF